MTVPKKQRSESKKPKFSAKELDRPVELVGSEVPSFMDNLSEEMKARFEELKPGENSILTQIVPG